MRNIGCIVFTSILFLSLALSPVNLDQSSQNVKESEADRNVFERVPTSIMFRLTAFSCGNSPYVQPEPRVTPLKPVIRASQMR